MLQHFKNVCKSRAVVSCRSGLASHHQQILQQVYSLQPCLLPTPLLCQGEKQAPLHSAPTLQRSARRPCLRELGGFALLSGAGGEMLTWLSYTHSLALLVLQVLQLLVGSLFTDCIEALWPSCGRNGCPAPSGPAPCGASQPSRSGPARNDHVETAVPDHDRAMSHGLAFGGQVIDVVAQSRQVLMRRVAVGQHDACFFQPFSFFTQAVSSACMAFCVEERSSTFSYALLICYACRRAKVVKESVSN